MNITARERRSVLRLFNVSEAAREIGITRDLDERLRLHKEGEGARWTMLYPPVKVLFVKMYRTRKDALKAENEATLILAKHGKDVRGGRWTDPSVVCRARLLFELYRARQSQGTLS
jgi:predicted GIY-YIG superfamily endonuclease